MNYKTYLAGEPVLKYLRNELVSETDAQRRLREETAAHPRAEMQISPEQGAFLAFLIQALCVRRALEVGVFTGYSSLTMALAMPPDGLVTACDLSEEFTRVARRYWAEAGVAHKMDLRLAPAAETLRELLAEGRTGWYDFAFIDADKPAYNGYYEAVLPLLRVGGVVMLDNMLWRGEVHGESLHENAVALRALNRKITHDHRVRASLLPMTDGMLLAVKL